MRREHLSELLPIAARAIEKGAALKGPRTVHWNTSGKCEAPRFVSRQGEETRQPLPAVGLTKKGKPFWHTKSRYAKWSAPAPRERLWLDMEVPCRKCAPCLQARARLWAQRAERETNFAARTWFGTLTLSPEEHYLSECRAGVDFSLLSPEEKLHELHRANVPLITKYMKRLRKNAGTSLRFIATLEAHKSGLPHYHLLVHETKHGALGERDLREQWPFGFSRWRAVNETSARAAWYVCKYLTKSAAARVRSSQRYGSGGVTV